MAKIVLSVCFICVSPAIFASAAPVRLVYSGRGAGTLDDVPFSETEFTITAISYGSDRTGNFGFYEHTDARIGIAGVGDFDIVSATSTYLNFAPQVVPIPDLPRYIYSIFLSDRDLVSLTSGPYSRDQSFWEDNSFGPVTGDGRLLQWDLPGSPSILTSGGILRFSDGEATLTFSATIIPEPSTLIYVLLIMVGYGYRIRR